MEGLEGLTHAFFNIYFKACDIVENVQQLVSYLYQFMHNFFPLQPRTKACVSTSSIQRTLLNSPVAHM